MQGRILKYLTAACAVAGAVACTTDEQPTRVTMPPRMSAAVALPLGCDFTQLKKDARAYFVLSNDPVYDLIQQWSSLVQKGTETTFQQKGIEILAYVESKVGTTAVVSTLPATAGDTFVRRVLVCLGQPTDAGTFTSSLGTNGLFGVRTAASKASIHSRLTADHPVYGAELGTSTTTWGGSNGNKPFIVLFGYERDFTFTSERAAVSTAYELKTIPAGVTFNPEILAGTCASVPPGVRLQHNSEILEKKELALCPVVALGLPADQPRGALALARRVTEWLAPRPLHAAVMVAGGMAGSLGGLSPIGPVIVAVDSVKLTIMSQPTTGSINVALTPPVVVKATTASGTPIEGLAVRLQVTGNNGSFTITGDGRDVPVLTKDGGFATFNNLKTTKAGGYTFVAISSLDGFVTQSPASAVSALINVNGQQ